MRHVFGYVLLFLLAYAIFLVARTPATPAFAWLERQMPILAADGVQGRLLAGTARGLQVGNVRLEGVRWRFEPLALLGARLAVSVESTHPPLRATAGLAADGLWHVDDFSGRLGLEQAARWLDVPAPPLSGAIEATDVDLGLDWSGTPVAASGRIRLIELGVSMPAPLELGSLVAELEDTDEGIAAVLADEGGPVGLSGRLTLAPDGRYRLRTEAVPRESADPAIVQALARMGSQAIDNNTWTLEWQGSLRGL